MHRFVSVLVLGTLCALLPVACKRTDQAELTKARADAEAAKAEAAKARAETGDLRAGRGDGVAKLPPAANTSGDIVTKAGLSSAGVATFADGKNRPFTNIWNLDVRQGQATVVGIVGAGETELPFFKFKEILLLGKGSYDHKERTVRLDELSRISFGPKILQSLVSDVGTKYEISYCEIELEATDGKKESFPCSLDSPPLLSISVQYADGIGKEKLAGAQLYGMTFRADES